MSDIRTQVSGFRDQAQPETTAEFRVGRVIGRSFDILFQDFIKFFVIALLAAAPYAVIALTGPVRYRYTLGTPIQSHVGTSGAALFAIGVLSVFLYAISQAATLYGAFQDMRGQPFELGAAFGRAFGRFFPLLGLVIAWGVAVGLGMIILVVPGCMLLAAFFVALPACVVERLGPLQSLSRSAALTKGHRWKIFGFYVLIAIVGLLASGLIKILFAVMAGFVAATLVGLVWNAAFAAFNSIAIAVMYHDLRVVKEGIDIDRIAAVFD